LDKIEFIENEPFARFNDELMTSEWSIEYYGADSADEFTFEKDYIVTNDVVYMNNPSFYKLLEIFGNFKEEKASKYSTKIDKSCVIWEPDRFKDLKVKPYIQFCSDYPKFNKMKYDAVVAALDEYYANLHK